MSHGGATIGGVSEHALTRYREHAPGATSQELWLAAAAGVPIPSDLAHALLGRPKAAANPRGEQDEHRLHPDGTGIFVLAAHRLAPDQHVVVTYIRLHSETQREMARRWFLDPLRILQRAFELGVAAGRVGAEPDQAWRRALPELLRSAPCVAGAASTPAARAAEGVRPAAAPVPRPAPAPTTPPAVVPDPATLSPGWSDTARRQLQGFRRCHPHLQEQVDDWGWVPAAQVVTILHASGPCPADGALAARVEPHGLLLVVVVVRDGVALYDGVRTLPRALRPQLDITPAPPPPAACASTTGLAAFVEATGLRVSLWSARAMQDAERHGVEPVLPSWLHLLDPIPPDQLRVMVHRLHWPLTDGHRYAGRTDGRFLLLLSAREGADTFQVARVGPIPADLTSPRAPSPSTS